MTAARIGRVYVRPVGRGAAGGSALASIAGPAQDAVVTDDRLPPPTRAWTTSSGRSLPPLGPFALRARVLTPLGSGGTRYLPDGVVTVDPSGRIVGVDDPTAWAARRARAEGAERTPDPVDLRPLLLLPGLVDLHAHLPQLPNAGLGGGLHLLDWLERYIYPLERGFDGPAAARLAPAAFERMAALGTTTAVPTASLGDELDETFRAAEAHGIRLVAGRVLMDRIRYPVHATRGRSTVDPGESAELCERWHGRDDGRLGYAFTPRFAVSCTGSSCRDRRAGRGRRAPTGRPTCPRTERSSPRSPALPGRPATTSTSTTAPAA